MSEPTSILGWMKYYLQSVSSATQDIASAPVIAKDVTVNTNEVFVVESDKHKFVRNLTVSGEGHIWGTLIHKKRVMNDGSRFVLYEGAEVMFYA